THKGSGAGRVPVGSAWTNSTRAQRNQVNLRAGWPGLGWMGPGGRIMNFLTVLPLTVVVVVGPQIMSAIFLASSRDAKRSSLALLGGAGLAILVGLTVWYVVFRLIRVSGSGNGQNDGTRRLIDWIVLAVLLVLMVMVFMGRK